MEIANRVAIITGGGSGIGLATALRLSSAGATIVLADADAAAGAQALATLRGSGHPHAAEAVFIHADVTRSSELRAVFVLVQERFGGFDILHNNAGLLSGLPRFPELPEERWRHVLDVNLSGVILGCQLAVPLLQARGGGVIVNTASMAAVNGNDADPVYAASKGGVLLFTRSFATPAAERGVRVCCICPGLVDTPLVRLASDPGIAALAESRPPISAEEVADGIAFLIGDDGNAGKALAMPRPGVREYLDAPAVA